jgi:uncharacterized protein DUF4234
MSIERRTESPPINPYDAPQSDLVDERASGTLGIFNRFSAWLYLLLYVFTLEIYGYYWLYVRSRTLNTYSTDKLSEVFMFFTIGVFVASIGLDIYSAFEYVPYQVLTVNDQLTYPIAILNILWAFMIRRRLQPLLSQNKTFGLHISGIMTFFFNGLYLQFKINEGLDALNEQLEIRVEPTNNEPAFDPNFPVA